MAKSKIHHVSLEFDTYEAFLHQVEHGPRVWADTHQCSHSDAETPRGDMSDIAWFGSPTFSAAMAVAHHGWPDGRAKLVKGLGSIAAPERAQRGRAIAYDVAGNTPDVARYIAGAPDCMATQGEDFVASRPVIRLVVNASASAQTTPAQIINRGVALLSLVDELEDAGHSVEIMSQYKAGNADHELRVSFPIKRAGEALELDRLAFILAHPSFLRRCLFALYEQQPGTWEAALYFSYGKPMAYAETELEPGVGYIGAVSNNNGLQFDTIPHAIDTVRAAISNALPSPVTT